MEGSKSNRDLQLPIEEILLPGIPCEITRTILFPKLSWRDLYTLSSVNRAWNYVVRSRQVYDESLRAHSTATFFPGYRSDDAIAFYSMGERSWYKLPPVPDLSACRSLDSYERRIPLSCGCVSMNGKIYVLGGWIANSGTWNRVYVFDVAAGGKWEQCASMKEPREEFACWIQDGKIYVFGGGRDLGTSRERRSIGGEAYDPEKNAWSPIKAMQSYAGENEHFGIAGLIQSDMATYNVLKDEWNVVRYPPDKYLLFNAQGKTHFISRISFTGQLFVAGSYDVHEILWTHLRSFSLDSLLPDHYVIVCPRAILEMEHELLAIAKWNYRVDCGSFKEKQGTCLLQSRGFSSENKEISWELRELTFEVDGPHTCFENLFWTNIYFVLKL